MATNIGLPTLTILFKQAAQAVANRSSRGYVGVIVRDAKQQGLHVLTSAALIPGELAVDNRQYISRAFIGSDRGVPSKVVVAVIAPGTEDTTALEAGLLLLESQSLDYIAPPPDVTEPEQAVLLTWVKARRELDFTEKLVLPKPVTPPDHMGVINFDEDSLPAGTVSFTAAQYASRMAGIMAGIPDGASCTNAVLPELTAVTKRTKAEQNAAIGAGKLILIHDGMKAKIARGVNSLTTIPPEGSADWSKIKIVAGMDLIRYYLRTTVDDEYCGKYANTYDNKCILVTAINDFFAELEGRGVLVRGQSYCEIDVAAQATWLKGQGIDITKLTEQQIREHDTGSFVFLRCGGKLVDAMEDFVIVFNLAQAVLAA